MVITFDRLLKKDEIFSSRIFLTPIKSRFLRVDNTFNVVTTKVLRDLIIPIFSNLFVASMQFLPWSRPYSSIIIFKSCHFLRVSKNICNFCSRYLNNFVFLTCLVSTDISVPFGGFKFFNHNIFTLLPFKTRFSPHKHNMRDYF
jgi:hypothetical protein